MTPAPLINIAEDAKSLAAATAAFLSDAINLAPDPFSLCLSGGSTPREAYELLGSKDYSIDWRKVRLFWGDERFVPMDHEDNNFRMARAAFIDRVPIPFSQVHPILTGSKTPQRAAALYEEALQAYYGGRFLDPERPLFNVTLLGLGEDGHIASLFPGNTALDERNTWATAVIGAKPEARISLTYPALESSRDILILVSGPKKRAILRRVLENDQALPACRVATRGKIHIFADRDALPS
ncbi:MAG TPA: 6-phosphogluconolactonase [Methylocella sp.]|nr:6-phosphogluconolactonase [Methylocella sp.]